MADGTGKQPIVTGGPPRYGGEEGERAVVALIVKLRGTGLACKRIALVLNGEGYRMRSGTVWTGQAVRRVLELQEYEASAK